MSGWVDSWEAISGIFPTDTHILCAHPESPKAIAGGRVLISVDKSLIVTREEEVLKIIRFPVQIFATQAEEMAEQG